VWCGGRRLNVLQETDERIAILVASIETEKKNRDK
jgi:uncharacterized small protein (DUF1192 family)